MKTIICLFNKISNLKVYFGIFVIIKNNFVRKKLINKTYKVTILKFITAQIL